MPVKQSIINKKKKKQPLDIPEVPEEVREALEKSQGREPVRATAARGMVRGRGKSPAEIASMTPAQRNKLKKDRARNRIFIDCSDDLSNALEEIVSMYRDPRGVDTRIPFSKSDLAELLMVLGLRKLVEDGSGIRRLMRLSYSPRYAHTIEAPPVPSLEDFDAGRDPDE